MHYSIKHTQCESKRSTPPPNSVFAFSAFVYSALTLLVRQQKGILPVKYWVGWHGYLSGARYRLAYGPADATATLASVKSRLVLLSGTSSP